MTTKELYEILQKYAESTKSDKDIAFKKLNEQSNKKENKESEYINKGH